MWRRIYRSSWPTLVAALLTTLPGCATVRSWTAGASQAPNVAPQTGGSNVVLVRATVGYWPGCDKLLETLKQGGAPATAIRGWEVNRTADRITAGRRSGADHAPLVLIGYSRGANDAIRLTRRLQQNGIMVNTLVLLESAAEESVPGNVEACLNVYRSSVAEEWAPVFRRMPVTAESANTQLVNYNVSFHDDAGAISELNPFSVCQSPRVLQMIEERVALALRPHESPPDEPLPAQIAQRP
jgi:hypothetical protein